MPGSRGRVWSVRLSIRKHKRKGGRTDLFEPTPIQLIYRIFSNFNCIESSLNSETLILDSSQLHSRQRGFQAQRNHLLIHSRGLLQALPRP